MGALTSKDKPGHFTAFVEVFDEVYNPDGRPEDPKANIKANERDVANFENQPKKKELVRINIGIVKVAFARVVFDSDDEYPF